MFGCCLFIFVFILFTLEGVLSEKLERMDIHLIQGHIAHPQNVVCTVDLYYMAPEGKSTKLVSVDLKTVSNEYWDLHFYHMGQNASRNLDADGVFDVRITCGKEWTAIIIHPKEHMDPMLQGQVHSHTWNPKAYLPRGRGISVKRTRYPWRKEKITPGGNNQVNYILYACTFENDPTGTGSPAPPPSSTPSTGTMLMPFIEHKIVSLKDPPDEKMMR